MEGRVYRPALWERGMVSLSEAMVLLALSLSVARRWGDILFLLFYPIWCGLWEAKIHSRPIHWLLGWRLTPFPRMSLGRSLARGVLRVLFPFLHVGWRRITLFDLCTGCRWTSSSSSRKSSRAASMPKPPAFR
ncbi:hypothetical protein [Methylacidimicrobium cyclopophantes]|uniref:hypothetical protein n=1 Tax=Methylacidimicrobium cyclopophantes TaxID=1041766 RepID=UPI0015B4D46F|nr:hypothetical protein [Methylacidimicrobium cyclopophantes]